MGDYVLEVSFLEIIVFLIGASVGSFLNVIIDRLPAGRSIIRPPSHCDACGRRLKPFELIPILSYLILRGRCRYCGAKIPLRVLLVEGATGTSFLLLYLKYGLTLSWGILSFYFSLFLTIAVIDLERRMIPNKLIYPASPLALLLATFHPLGLAAGRTPLGNFLYSLLGGAVGFVILLLPALIWAEGMGWGDVKLSGLIGLALGFPGGAVALGLAILSGGILALLLLVLRIKGRKDAIPFGPFLSAGALIALIWGKFIVAWYLGLFT